MITGADRIARTIRTITMDLTPITMAPVTAAIAAGSSTMANCGCFCLR